MSRSKQEKSPKKWVKKILKIIFYLFILKKIYFYFILLYNTVLVLPYIDMNPPRKEEWNWGNQPA